MRYCDWLSLGDVPTSGVEGSWSTFLEMHGLRMGKRWFHKGELVLLPKGKGRDAGQAKAMAVYHDVLLIQVPSPSERWMGS